MNIRKDLQCTPEEYRMYEDGFEAGVKAKEVENARLKELLDEVRLSGVESDLPGIDYVTVQIDRWLWSELQEEES